MFIQCNSFKRHSHAKNMQLRRNMEINMEISIIYPNFHVNLFEHLQSQMTTDLLISNHYLAKELCQKPIKDQGCCFDPCSSKFICGQDRVQPSAAQGLCQIPKYSHPPICNSKRIKPPLVFDRPVYTPRLITALCVDEDIIHRIINTKIF